MPEDGDDRQVTLWARRRTFDVLVDAVPFSAEALDDELLLQAGNADAAVRAGSALDHIGDGELVHQRFRTRAAHAKTKGNVADRRTAALVDEIIGDEGESLSLPPGRLRILDHERDRYTHRPTVPTIERLPHERLPLARSTR